MGRRTKKRGMKFSEEFCFVVSFKKVDWKKAEHMTLMRAACKEGGGKSGFIVCAGKVPNQLGRGYCRANNGL